MKILNTYLLLFLCLCTSTLGAQDEEPFVFNYYVCETDNCITLQPNIGDIDEQGIECYAWESEDDISSPQQQEQEVCPIEDTEYSLFVIDEDGNIIEEILYKVHVLVGEPPAFTGGNDPNSQNKARNQYSCEIASDINSFLEGNEYSEVYQNASLGLYHTGEKSRLDLELFSDFSSIINVSLESPGEENTVRNLARFLSVNDLNIATVDFEDFQIDPPLPPLTGGDQEPFYIYPDLLCLPDFWQDLDGWKKMKGGIFFQQTDDERERLRMKYMNNPEAIQRIAQLWACNVLGAAQEEAVLNSLGLHQHNSLPGASMPGGRPDGFGYRFLGGNLSPLFTYQPLIIEVKGKYQDNGTFFYGMMSPTSQPATQLRAYANYIVNTSARLETSLSHGIILIVPEGTIIHPRVKKYCSDRNIPLYKLEIYYKDIGVDNHEHEIKITFPDIINFDALNYDDTLASYFGPLGLVIKYSLELDLICEFNYDPVRINYDYWISEFERTTLIPVQLPPNANDICEDTVEE